jgi:hypothetical protein
LKEGKAGDSSVVLSTTGELLIRLKIARALSLRISPTLIAIGVLSERQTNNRVNCCRGERAYGGGLSEGERATFGASRFRAVFAVAAVHFLIIRLAGKPVRALVALASMLSSFGRRARYGAL